MPGAKATCRPSKLPECPLAVTRGASPTLRIRSTRASELRRKQNCTFVNGVGCKSGTMIQALRQPDYPAMDDKAVCMSPPCSPPD